VDYIEVEAAQCPNSYEPALQYRFGGGVNGCHCRFNGSTIILEGFCSTRLAEVGCSDVDRQSPFTVSRWDSQTKLKCVRRASVGLWNESASAPFKQCGTS
jgi:hypothetical protein